MAKGQHCQTSSCNASSKTPQLTRMPENTLGDDALPPHPHSSHIMDYAPTDLLTLLHRQSLVASATVHASSHTSNHGQ